MFSNWLKRIQRFCWPAARRTSGLRPRQRPFRLALETLEDRINPNAILNPVGAGLTIVLNGADAITLSTANGSLVIKDTTPGQTITDTTARFTLTGGNQTATENATLTGDFTSLTVTGAGGGQSVTFLGGSFVATNINDGAIPTVGFSTARSSFSGALNVRTSKTLSQNAALAATGAVNLTVTGSNAALNITAGISSQNAAITLQATGAVSVAAGVRINSGTGTLVLAADVTPAGIGDDGLGTLTIAAGAQVYGANITLRGADEDIAPTATVGQAQASTGSATLPDRNVRAPAHGRSGERDRGRQ